MSDLQLALLALGVLIIVAVVLFNWWQERSIRKDAETRFSTPSRDVLMDDLEANDSTAASVAEDSPPDRYHFSDEEVSDETPVRKQSSPQQAPAFTASSMDTDTDISMREDDEPTFDDDWMLDQVKEDDTPARMEAAPISKLKIDQPLPVASPVVEAKPVAATEQVMAQPQDEQVSMPEGVNQQIDLVALLYLSQPASGFSLREFLLSLADIDKPIYAYGLDNEGTWRLLTREQEDTKFTRAICNVQLADRSGPISRASLSRFQQAVDNMGAQLAAQIEWLGSPDPLHYANELDQFCIEVDQMVGFHLVQGESGPFTGTKLRGLVEAGGLVLHDDGSFYHESEYAQKTFSLINQDNNPFSLEMLRSSVIRGVTFQLDIPRVKSCLEVFNHMVLMARQMENSLSAKLVDDKQRPLGDAQIEKIRQQLKMIHAKMVTRGIVPGSDNALRLFS